MNHQHHQTSSMLIAGLGSDQGDDRAGWCFIELLDAATEHGFRTATLREPIDLLHYLDDCDRLVLVDACCSGAAPGSLVRLEWPDRQIEQLRSNLSHNVGIDPTLRLAEQLGRLPKKVILYGIEAMQLQAMAPLCEAVELGVRRLALEIVDEIGEVLHA